MGYGTEVKTIEMAFTGGGDWTWPWLALGGVGCFIVEPVGDCYILEWIFLTNQKEKKMMVFGNMI